MTKTNSKTSILIWLADNYSLQLKNYPSLFSDTLMLEIFYYAPVAILGDGHKYQHNIVTYHMTYEMII